MRFIHSFIKLIFVTDHLDNITLSQFFAENDMIEMTDELKEFYDAWIALSPDKRKNILETMKMMK